MPSLAALLPPTVQAAVVRAATALPQRIRRALAGRPIMIDGQRLATDAQLLLKLQRASGVSLVNSHDPVNARQMLDTAAEVAAGPRIQGVSTRELSVPGRNGTLSARLYRPDTATSPCPLLVFYHGGGFTMGSIASHDNTARFVARESGVAVLSVAYRLAPEHPFPAGVQDALAAFDYAHSHAAELGSDPTRIAVGGDSAGGNLAAVVAQLAAERQGPAPAFQLLIYPAVDFSVRTRSRDLFSDGFFLTDSDIRWTEDRYLPTDVDKTNPQLSPLHADDLAGLPPAYVVTAGFDPLRDEGEEYARALEKAGVPVVLRRQEDLIHGFVNFLGAGERFYSATLEVAHALREGLLRASQD